MGTSQMGFTEQLNLMRSTNILVSAHGAGLMFIMFAAGEIFYRDYIIRL